MRLKGDGHSNLAIGARVISYGNKYDALPF